MKNYNYFKKMTTAGKNMLITCCTIFICVLMSVNTNAQTISATTYPTTAGTLAVVSYTSLGTLITTGSDDGNTASLTNIGFDFYFDGAKYSQFGVNANGIIRLGALTTGTNHINNLANASMDPKIAPYWDDLNTGSDGYVKYGLNGTAPNRSLVVEWKTNRLGTSGGATTAPIIFQAVLFETTNVIQFIYGGTIAANASGYSVGFSNSGTVMVSIATTSNTPTYGSDPNTAQTTAIVPPKSYSFTPGAQSAQPTGISCTPNSQTQITIGWTDVSNELSYDIYYSTSSTVPLDGTSGYVTSALNTTSKAVTGLTPGTAYFFKLFARREALSTAATTNCSTPAPPTWVGNTSNDWGTPANWNPAAVPTASDNVIIATGGTNQPTISAAAVCNSLTLNSGTTLIINSTLGVSGNWTNNGGTVSGTGTVTLSSATCAIGGSAASATFPNLTVTGTVTMGINTNVTGNFSQTAGTFNVSSTATSYTLAITGNFSQSVGQFNVSNGANSSIVTVGGTYTLSSGKFTLENAAAATGASVTVTGLTKITGTGIIIMDNAGSTATCTFNAVDFTADGTGGAAFNATAAVSLDFGTGSTANHCQFKIAGNLVHSSTNFFYISSTSAVGSMIFNKSGTQTFDYTGTSPQYVTYTVNSGSILQLANNFSMGTAGSPAASFNVSGGATLDFQNFILGGTTSNSFITSALSTLKCSNLNGIVSTTVGSVSTSMPTRTFDPATNYEFYGTNNPLTTNFGLTTMRNLTISNTGGVVNLSAAIVVNGTMLINSGGGSLDVTATNHAISCGTAWTNNGAFNARTGTVTLNNGGATGTVTISGTTTFYNLSWSTASTTYNFGSSTTTIANALTNSAGTMDGGTSTVIFTGAAGSMAGGNAKNFNNLQINSLAVISHAAGSNITLTGNYTNNGSFTQPAAQSITFGSGGTQTMSGTGTSIFGSFAVAIALTVVNAGSHNFTVSGTSFTVAATGAGATFNGQTNTVTMSGAVAIGTNGNYNFNNVTISGSLSDATNRNLDVSGNWTNNGAYTKGTETITFSGGAQLINGSASTVFNDVSINNTSTTISGAAGNSVTGTLRLTLGTVNVGTGLTMGNGAIINRNSGTLSAAPTFTTSVNVTYSGNPAVTTGPEIPVATTVLNNLLINKSGGVTLGSAATVNGQLTLNTAGGILNLAGQVLTMASGAPAIASTPGFSNTSMIIANGGGELRKMCTTNAQANYTFPVGDDAASANGAEYTPLTTSASASTGATFTNAYISVKVSEGKHGSNNSTTHFLTRYWTVKQSGITGAAFTTTVAGTFINTSADVSGTLGSIKAAQLSGTFNQATNPWVKSGSALAGTPMTVTGAALTSGTDNIFTGITSADPTVSITGGGVTVCTGASVTLTSNPVGDASFTYSWTGLITGSITSSTATPTTSSVGGPNSYTVTVKDANGIASLASSAVNVTVVAQPVAGTLTPSGVQPAVCEGASVSATATAGSGGTGTPSDELEVSLSGGTYTAYNSGDPIPTAGETSVTIRTRHLTTGSGCNASSYNTTSWVVNAQPTAGTLTPSGVQTAVCDGASVSATATAGSGGAGTTTDELQVSLSGGAYTAYISGDPIPTAGETSVSIRTRRTATGSGCTASSYNTTSWAVNAQPTAGTLTPSGVQPAVCDGVSVSATATAGSGGAGTTTDELEVSLSGGTYTAYNSGDPIPTAGETSVSIRTRRTATGSGCNASSYNTTSWAVNAQPTAGTLTPSGVQPAVCTGTPVSATATAGSGGAGTTTDELEVSLSGGTYTAYSSGDPIPTTGETSVSIRTRRTATGSGCNASSYNTTSWAVEAVPTVAGLDKRICATGGTLDGSFGGSATGVTWSGGAGTYGDVNDINSNYIPTSGEINATQVIMTLTSTGSVACPAAVDNNVVIDIDAAVPPQPAPISGAPAAMCTFPQTLTLTIPTVPEAQSYTWYAGPGSLGMTFNGATNTTSQSITFNSTPNSTFNVRVDAINTCGNSAFRSVSIRTKVSGVASITGSAQACPNDVLPYSAAAVTGATDYTWSNSDGVLFDGNASPYTANDLAVNITFPGGWTGGSICITANLLTCFSSPPQCKTIIAAPEKPSGITGTFQLCPGTQDVDYFVTNVAGLSYTWTPPANSVIDPFYPAGSNQVRIDYNANFVSGDISVYATGPCGTSPVRSKTVSRGSGGQTVAQPNNISGPINALCGAANVTYTALPVNGSATYNWTFPTGTTFNGSPNANPVSVTFPASIPATPAQTISVTAQISCVTSSPRVITIKGAPGKATVSGPSTVCSNSTGNVFSVPAYAGPVTYTWYLPAGATITNGSGTNSITVTWGPDETDGTVTLFASNACGNATSSKAVDDNCRVSTGSADAASLLFFNAYPNPASTSVNVEFKAEKGQQYVVRMLDLSGRILSTLRNVSGGETTLENLDVSTLAKGIYMLTVESGNNIVRARIVVE